MSIDPVKSVVAFAASPDHKAPPERARETERKAAASQPVASAPQPLPQSRALQVSASFGSGHLVIYRILDKETGELIEQVPPQRFLDAAQNTEESPANEGNSQKLNTQF